MFHSRNIRRSWIAKAPFCCAQRESFRASNHVLRRREFPTFPHPDQAEFPEPGQGRVGRSPAGDSPRMPFDCAVLLAPVSGDKPCGEALSEHALYEEFKNLVASPSRPDWARYLDRAVALAQTSRDLRAWVWLTRASLCQHGVPGLATGLRLMA